jgi:hypothetical protein
MLFRTVCPGPGIGSWYPMMWPGGVQLTDSRHALESELESVGYDEDVDMDVGGFHSYPSREWMGGDSHRS